MPEEAGPECAADGSGITGPADEVGGRRPDTERVVGDERRPEDE